MDTVRLNRMTLLVRIDKAVSCKGIDSNMKNFLYNAIAQVSARQILVLDWIHSKLLFVHVYLYGLIRVLMASVGFFLLNLIDKEKTQKAQETLANAQDLKLQSLELRLLAAASTVRDHAEASDDWTEEHTEAISAIGDALLNELGWEEENIHQYLREVVESIDGLVYDLEP